MASNSILVVGGGFAGITAALEAAEVGYEVYMVEKNPYLGGRVAQLNQYFPKLCPPSCGLEIQFQRIKKNKNLKKVYTLSEVTKVSGSPGDFTVTVTQKPRYVNERCTACGDCEAACTTEFDSEFDFGLGKRGAIYKTHPFMFPMRYVFDKDAVGADEAQAIKDACPYEAVELDDEARTFELNVGTIVWATGWKPYDVANLENLGAGKLANVVTNMQFERLAAPAGPTGGDIRRPDGKPARKIAFVQCAGSRDQNHLNYCSYICCMASLKHVRYVAERDPKAKVVVYYIDLRTPGRYDKFKAMTEENENLSLVKGKVANIVEDAEGNPVVTVENAVTGIKAEEKFDLVVLATGMQPSLAGEALPARLGLDEDGFLVDESSGFVAAGCAKLPLDVMKSAQSGTSAALKAIANVVGR